MRLTGVPVLAHDDGKFVAAQAGLAGGLSLVLVAIVLGYAFRCRYLFTAFMLALLVSLAWTAAAATLLIGHLNLISVDFGVLCIGLGADFGIHYCLRYSELALTAESRNSALRETSRQLLRPLSLCAITTGIAFLAFIPTSFVGMAELGAITAAGMSLSLLATVTVLPAGIAVLLPHQRNNVTPSLRFRAGSHELDAPKARRVILISLLVTTAALYPALQTRFDAHPLGVRDPQAESVQLMRELLADTDAMPWSMNVLVNNEVEALALQQRLRARGKIGRIVGPSDLVPNNQALMHALIDDTAMAVLPSLDVAAPTQYDVPKLRASFTHLAEQSVRLATALPHNTPVRAVSAALEKIANENLSMVSAAEFGELERRLLTNYFPAMHYLTDLLQPESLTVDTLPLGLRGLVVAADGRRRVEVYPAFVLSDLAEISNFVDAVLEIAPGAYGEALTIRELSTVVLEAFAMLLGAIGIMLMSLISLRSIVDSLTILVPLLVASVLTMSACVALSIPVNFANIIVLPLLLGIGIDTAIHLVHRARQMHDPSALLRTSTARAALFSGLTTLASFGTLALARHQGLASMGAMLFVGVIAVLVANFVFVPALLALRTQRYS